MGRCRIKSKITKYLIVGHTDTKGTNEYNLKLSLDRAKKRIKEPSSIDLERANKSVKRAQNRIRIAKTFSRK